MRQCRQLVYVLALVFFQSAFSVSGAALISVSSTNIIFREEACIAVGGQSLWITNSGDATLNYTITSDRFWLSVEDSSGSIASGAGKEVAVKVRTRGLKARRYPGRLIISDPAAGNGPVAVQVDLHALRPVLPTRVLAWGNNDYGQTNVPPHLTNVVAVSSFYRASLVLKEDGCVELIGDGSRDNSYVPSSLTNATEVAYCLYCCLAITADGEVVSWGKSANTNLPSGLSNVMSVAVGGYHALALKGDGRVVAWGGPYNEQYLQFGQTNVPPEVTNAVAICASPFSSAALLSDGKVVSWGYVYGSSPPADLTNAVAIAAGYDFSVALRNDGTISFWGDPYYLGNPQQCPPLESLSNVVAISAGNTDFYVVMADGSVAGYGNNIKGELVIPAEAKGACGVAGGVYHAIALLSRCNMAIFSASALNPSSETNVITRNISHTFEATAVVEGGYTQLVCNGWIGTGSIPASGTSNRVTVRVTNDSSITWTWATNFWLNASPEGFGSLNITDGWYPAGSSLCITATPMEGFEFYGWQGDTNGCTIDGRVITVPLLQALGISADFTNPDFGVTPTDFSFTAAKGLPSKERSFFICNASTSPLNYTIRSDSPVWFYTWPTNGTIPPGSTVKHFLKANTVNMLPGTRAATLTVTPDTTNEPVTLNVSATVASVPVPTMVVEWGTIPVGQPDPYYWEDLVVQTDTVAVAACAYGSTAVKSGGKCVNWSTRMLSFFWIPNVVAICGGFDESMALTSDGTVLQWDSRFHLANMPQGLTNMVAVSKSAHYAMALREDGTIASWSDFTYSYTEPQLVEQPIALAMGDSHAMLLGASGIPVIWNEDYSQQLYVPPEVSNVVAISAGSQHFLALMENGTVAAWGNNDYGQTNVPSGLTNAVAISAKGNHSLALKSDGTVVGWGDESYGQSQTPVGLTNVIAIADGYCHSVALVPAAMLLVDSSSQTAFPPSGTNWVIRNAFTDCHVDQLTQAGTQIVSTGWIGSGSVDGSGTSNSFRFFATNDSTIAWLWSTNYWVDIAASLHGTVSPASGWFTRNTNLQVLAAPDTYYHFGAWSGSFDSDDSLLSVNVEAPLSLNAAFLEDITTGSATPHWWLAANGWTSGFEAAAGSDTDEDGLPAWQEYLADTEPTNAQSVLCINDLEIVNGELRVSWCGGAQAWQYLERCTNLQDANPSWTPVWSNPPPNSSVTNFTDSFPAHRQQFYRLRSHR